MADTLVTYHPDGTITRQPWRMSESAQVESAFAQLQGSRRPKRPPDYGMGCQPDRFHRERAGR